MPDLSLGDMVIRWVHIVSACLALGVPLFVRYILTPAAEHSLDPESHRKLRTAVNQLWRIIVYLLITAFILSGFYMFIFLVLPLNLGDARPAYHAIFGLKMTLALVVFFLASALAGRSPGLAFIRANAKFWQTIMILLLLMIVMLAGGMRSLREHALRGASAPAAPLTAPGASSASRSSP